MLHPGYATAEFSVETPESSLPLNHALSAWFVFFLGGGQGSSGYTPDSSLGF